MHWAAIAFLICAVILVVWLRGNPSTVVATPGSGVEEDFTEEPKYLNDNTLESVGATRDRGTMGAASGKVGHSRTHFAPDGVDADTTERFGSDISRCLTGCKASPTHHSNPLIGANRATGPSVSTKIPPEACHYNGFYRYDEPCALYERR